MVAAAPILQFHVMMHMLEDIKKHKRSTLGRQDKEFASPLSPLDELLLGHLYATVDLFGRRVYAIESIDKVTRISRALFHPTFCILREDGMFPAVLTFVKGILGFLGQHPLICEKQSWHYCFPEIPSVILLTSEKKDQARGQKR